MKKKNTILIISYIFPPTNAAGVYRVSKFVKYWHAEGWRIIILTPQRRADTTNDAGLLADIPDDVTIYRTKTWEPDYLIPTSTKSSLTQSTRAARATVQNTIILKLGKLFRLLVQFFFIPDEKILWHLFSKKTIDTIIQKHKPDIIYSTAPPPTVHLVARRASKRHHIPWVADFRDEWTLNPFNAYPTPIHRYINQQLEKRVLADAAAVMTISNEMTEDFSALTGQKLSGKFHTIYNGYDDEDFADAPPPLKNFFTITYTGNFYGHRNPNSLFRALQNIVSTSQIPTSQFRVSFVGANTFQIEEDINFELISPIISLQSYVPHHEAISLMRTSPVLLLIVSKESGNRSVTGKIFEYLASGRPILALVPPEGAAADILKHSPDSIICDPTDVKAIAEAIYTLYSRWNKGELRTPSEQSTIARFNRKYLAEETSNIFKALLES